MARNPALDVSRLKSGSDGIQTWTGDEIRAFEALHAIGTQARLGFAHLTYTDQRRSDVGKLGPQHLVDGELRFTQAKNADRQPARMLLSVLPACSTSLTTVRAATPLSW